MTRRARSAFIAWMRLAVVAIATAAVSLHGAVAAKPNIVLILADDLGYGDVRCLNPEGKIATPEIDRLAAAGMVFTDAHSSSAVCTPTHAMSSDTPSFSALCRWSKAIFIWRSASIRCPSVGL